jgi:alcohol dehydrogenase (cytochrome c)
MRNEVSVGPLPQRRSAHLIRKLSQMNHVLPLTALMATIGCLSVVAQQGTSQSVTSPPVTSQMLLDGLKDPTKWLMFGGDYTSRRNSPLTQLTPQNVNQLTPQWLFQTPAPVPGRGLESTPVVLDGVMYITGNYNHAWALDARTGRMIWHYQRTLPELLRVCCGMVNRGAAILGDKLYMGTLDAHLVALDRKTGKVLWDATVEEPKNGYSITLAPLVVKNKVIVGVSGGDYASRGFIDAYDAETGTRAWRFYTVPGAGERGSETWPGVEPMLRGGGAVWATGAYDPALNLVYYGTGNPNPDYYGDDRKGDNLYTCSLLALDADTGVLKWHYQFTPHDIHDWDSTQVPVLGDVTIAGQQHKVVMLANRNGFFYVLDRESGKLLLGKPFTGTNWARQIGPDGRPVVLEDVGTREKCLPDQRGGTNFMPPSFDPVRRLFFVTARETCVTWVSTKPTAITLGDRVPSGGPKHFEDGPQQYSALRAIDPATGEMRWEHRFRGYPSEAALDLSGGAMSTATGLVFSGDNDGYLNAFDSASGKELWRFQTGAPIWGVAPITYMLDGVQWVAIPSGVTLTTFALPGSRSRSR